MFQANKIDIFSLGCIFYFVLTEGEHPFGNNERLWDNNIVEGHTQLKEKYDSLRLQCNLLLLELMLAKDPKVRPDAEHILAHPIFWTYEKMLDFIVKISDFVNKPTEPYIETCKGCIKKLEENYFPKISHGSQDGWFSLLDSTLKPIFVQCYKKDQKDKALMLIRTIRNYKHHYHESTFDSVIKAHIGKIPDVFMTYWLKHFPTLVNEMRDAFDDLKTETSLSSYF